MNTTHAIWLERSRSRTPLTPSIREEARTVLAQKDPKAVAGAIIYTVTLEEYDVFFDILDTLIDNPIAHDIDWSDVVSRAALHPFEVPLNFTFAQSVTNRYRADSRPLAHLFVRPLLASALEISDHDISYGLVAPFLSLNSELDPLFAELPHLKAQTVPRAIEILAHATFDAQSLAKLVDLVTLDSETYSDFVPSLTFSHAPVRRAFDRHCQSSERLAACLKDAPSAAKVLFLSFAFPKFQFLDHTPLFDLLLEEASAQPVPEQVALLVLLLSYDTRFFTHPKATSVWLRSFKQVSQGRLAVLKSGIQSIPDALLEEAFLSCTYEPLTLESFFTKLLENKRTLSNRTLARFMTDQWPQAIRSLAFRLLPTPNEPAPQQPKGPQSHSLHR